MYIIGKIDISIYSCVTNDIITEDVIITDERIQHIKERHPNDFERYCSYISYMLEKPDYIFQSDRPNTAFVMNSFTDNGKNFELILHLQTSSDDSRYKNSIITFLKISDRKKAKYLRNKKILYKSE